MSTYDAFHLPQLAAHEITAWATRTYAADITLRFPVLDAALAALLVERLRAARAQLALHSLAEIVNNQIKMARAPHLGARRDSVRSSTLRP